MWRQSSSLLNDRRWFGSEKNKGVTQRRNTKTSREDVRRSEHDCWCPKRDQDGRAPRGVGARGSRVAGGRRAQRAGGAGRGPGLGVRRRGVSRGGRDARAEAGGRVGQGGDG